MLLTWCGRNRFRGVCTTIFLCCLLHTGSAFGSETTRSGQEIYEAACSSCHGLDGSGREQSRVGFDTPLPDFADCHFAAREPSSDWVAVAHQGGPARKFSHLMPDSWRVFSFTFHSSRTAMKTTAWPPTGFPASCAIRSLAKDSDRGRASPPVSILTPAGGWGIGRYVVSCDSGA